MSQGFPGLRPQDLGDDDGGGCGHDGGRQQVARVEQLLGLVGAAQHGDIGREHCAGYGSHAAHHHGEQFGLGHARDVGPHHQGRLGLADENIGRHGQRLRA